MSQTFSLVCHATKKAVWVGQGWGSMTTFYSGDEKKMRALHAFLVDHVNQSLTLLCDDRYLLAEYEDYAAREDGEANAR